MKGEFKKKKVTASAGKSKSFINAIETFTYLVKLKKTEYLEVEKKKGREKHVI